GRGVGGKRAGTPTCPPPARLGTMDRAAPAGAFVPPGAPGPARARMSYPHRIRLRGPWEHEPLLAAVEGAPLPPPGSLRLPARWADGPLATFTGPVRLRRHFAYPPPIPPPPPAFLPIHAP